MKTIYKKDSKGNIRFLSVYTIKDILIQTSGIINTINPIEHAKKCKGKNIGKINETTPEQQAISEGNSIIKEKLRQGYFETISDADKKGGSDFILPMLAKDFKKEVKNVIFPCYAQPKLDGMRALGIGTNTLMSRTGKVVLTVTHINFNNLRENILDGELYAHGETFQQVMRLVKKYRKGETEKIKYHVYDLVMDAPFRIRHGYLIALVNENPEIELVKTVYIKDMKDLLKFHKENIEAGYEGTMIRHTDEGYQVNKRSLQLLKYKDFLDESYKVIDVVPSESRPEQGVVVCTSSSGTFSCGMKFSHEEREEILINKKDYINKMAEVRFFEYSESGIPRFPVCVGFRIDK